MTSAEPCHAVTAIQELATALVVGSRSLDAGVIQYVGKED